MSNTRKATGTSKATGDAAVLDLDAARARRLESSQADLQFVFDGETFVVPPPMEWGLHVPEMLAAGQVLEALAELLGEGQAERFIEAKPKIGDLMDLMKWLGEASAGSLGNS